MNNNTDLIPEEEDQEKNKDNKVTVISGAQATAIIKITKELIELLKQQAFWMSHTVTLFGENDRAKLKSIRSLYKDLERHLDPSKKHPYLSEETLLYRVPFVFCKVGYAIATAIYYMMFEKRPEPKLTQQNTTTIESNIKIATNIKKHLESWKTSPTDTKNSQHAVHDNFFNTSETKRKFAELEKKAGVKINHR